MLEVLYFGVGLDDRDRSSSFLEGEDEIGKAQEPNRDPTVTHYSVMIKIELLFPKP